MDVLHTGSERKRFHSYVTQTFHCFVNMKKPSHVYRGGRNRTYAPEGQKLKMCFCLPVKSWLRQETSISVFCFLCLNTHNSVSWKNRCFLFDFWSLQQFYRRLGVILRDTEEATVKYIYIYIFFFIIHYTTFFLIILTFFCLQFWVRIQFLILFSTVALIFLYTMCSRSSLTFLRDLVYIWSPLISVDSNTKY